MFTRLNTKVDPQKGSALFWYNYRPSGEIDERTLHGGCPVLLGSKWGTYGKLFLINRKQLFVHFPWWLYAVFVLKPLVYFPGWLYAEFFFFKNPLCISYDDFTLCYYQNPLCISHDDYTCLSSWLLHPCQSIYISTVLSLQWQTAGSARADRFWRHCVEGQRTPNILCHVQHDCHVITGRAIRWLFLVYCLLLK